MEDSARPRFGPCVLAALAMGLFVANRAGEQPALAGVPAPAPARAGQAVDPGPVKPIMDGMHGAEARLKSGDTGPATRTIQQKVVNDLAKLIEAARPKSRPQPQQSPDSRPQNGSQNSQPQGNPSSSPSSQPAGGPPNRKAPAKASRAATEKRSPENKQRPLLREVWGHLPPALRERVAPDFQETVLPAYDDLVRRYFEALLSGSSSSGSPMSGSPSSGSPSNGSSGAVQDGSQAAPARKEPAQ